jgi:photosystem II stability/assembly factor-like uncharacterized protein
MGNKKYSLGLLFLVIGLLSVSYGYNYHGCAMAPNSDQGWVVTIETTLVNHTWDGGESWELQQILTSRDFFDVFFLDTLNGWTTNRLAMIWHTSNGGLNWNWQSLGMSKFGTRVFFLDSLHGWVAAGEGICIRTTDGGNNWLQVFIHNIPLDTVDFYGVSFVDTLHGWMAAGRYPEIDSLGVHFKKGQGFIVYSNNGGDSSSWVTQRHDTIYDFFDVKFKDTLEGWVVGGNDSTMEACVLHTTNGGQNWSQQTIPASAKYLRALELVDGNKLWAIGRNGTIIHSLNGGSSWSVQNCGVDTTLFDIDFADSLRGLIAGNGFVFYTQNGGRNWFQANLAVPVPTTLILPDNGVFRNNSIVNFIWHRSQDHRVHHYTLQYANNAGFVGAVSRDSLSDTTFTTASPLSDTTYFWRIAAVDSTGNRSWSSVWSFEIDTRNPQTPVLIEPIGNAWQNNPVTLQWTEVTFDKENGNKVAIKRIFNSPVQYIIQVDTIRNFATPLVVDTATTNQLLINLGEKRYFWRVKAFDLAGNQGSFSITDSFRMDTTSPTIPIQVNPPNDTTIIDSIVNLIWFHAQDNRSGVANYQVQVSLNSNFIPPIRDTVSSDTFCRFIMPDTLYYWRVRAADHAGNRSNWSSVRSFRLHRPYGIEGKEILNLDSQIVLKANPNPFSKNINIRIPKSLNSNSVIRIYDALGKLVISQQLPTNRSFIWYGRDKQGKEVKPGIYFVMVGQASVQKLRLVKIN